MLSNENGESSVEASPLSVEKCVLTFAGKTVPYSVATNGVGQHQQNWT